MNAGTTLILDAFWVDNKPFPTIQHTNSNDGHIFHDYYYGKARCLGWMDLCLLNSAIKKHKITHIILQNLDTFGKICDAIGEVKVCTAYKYNKFQIISSNIPNGKELVHCEPIYKTVEFGGWEFPESGEVPCRAKTYMQYLLTHTHVNSITCFTDKLKVTVSYDANKHIVFSSEPNQ